MGREFRLLGKDMHRAAFSCGEPSLDIYVKTQATQDMRRRVAVCHVLPGGDDGKMIVGYYTLSTASVSLARLPAELRRGVGLYPDVPAALLGRLAVDKRFQGQGLGDVLLGDALLRVLDMANVIAVHLVLVDALHEMAAQFYERRDFKRFEDSALRLYLPVAKIREIFGAPSGGSQQP